MHPGDLRISSLDELIVDDRAKGIFRVHRSAFTGQAVFEIERRRVFERCWLYVAHASEVAAPGSFVTRTVGGRPIILARGKDGALAALYNSCAHRGAMVCRKRHGTARAFSCGYHGWSYELKYAARANWKLLFENSADGYHAVATHATYFDYLKARDANIKAE